MPSLHVIKVPKSKSNASRLPSSRNPISSVANSTTNAIRCESPPILHVVDKQDNAVLLQSSRNNNDEKTSDLQTNASPKTSSVQPIEIEFVEGGSITNNVPSSYEKEVDIKRRPQITPEPPPAKKAKRLNGGAAIVQRTSSNKVKDASKKSKVPPNQHNDDSVNDTQSSKGSSNVKFSSNQNDVKSGSNTITSKKTKPALNHKGQLTLSAFFGAKQTATTKSSTSKSFLSATPAMSTGIHNECNNSTASSSSSSTSSQKDELTPKRRAMILNIVTGLKIENNATTQTHVATEGLNEMKSLTHTDNNNKNSQTPSGSDHETNLLEENKGNDSTSIKLLSKFELSSTDESSTDVRCEEKSKGADACTSILIEENYGSKTDHPNYTATPAGGIVDTTIPEGLKQDIKENLAMMSVGATGEHDNEFTRQSRPSSPLKDEIRKIMPSVTTIAGELKTNNSMPDILSSENEALSIEAQQTKSDAPDLDKSDSIEKPIKESESSVNDKEVALISLRNDDITNNVPMEGSGRKESTTVKSQKKPVRTLADFWTTPNTRKVKDNTGGKFDRDFVKADRSPKGAVRAADVHNEGIEKSNPEIVGNLASSSTTFQNIVEQATELYNDNQLSKNVITCENSVTSNCIQSEGNFIEEPVPVEDISMINSNNVLGTEREVKDPENEKRRQENKDLLMDPKSTSTPSSKDIEQSIDSTILTPEELIENAKAMLIAPEDLTENAKAILSKHEGLRQKYLRRAQEVLNITLGTDFLKQDAVDIPVVVDDHISLEKGEGDIFPDAAVTILASLIEGQSLSLSKLATSVHSKLQVLFDASKRTLFTVDNISSKIKLIATRKRYIKKPSAVFGSDDITETNIFEDESLDCLWRWEVTSLEIFPDVIVPLIKKARQTRRKIAAQFNAVTRLLICLQDADKLLKSSDKSTKIDAILAKISVEEEKVLKFDREEEKARLFEEAKRVKEAAKEREQQEKTRRTEERKKEAERKKVEAANEKKRKEELKAKEKEELEKREIEAKEAELKKQRNCFKSFFTSSSDVKSSSKAPESTTKLSAVSIPQPDGRWRQSNANPNTFKNESFRKSINSDYPVDPKSMFDRLSKQAKLSRQRRTRRVNVTVFLACCADDPFAAQQQYSEQQEVQVLNKYKFFSFCEDIRPPYHGTWSKTSTVVTGRNPFGKDINHLDYDNDSEAEWEEGDDELGEDLRDGEMGEEDEDKDEEGDPEEEDGWLAADDEIDEELDEQTKLLRQKKIEDSKAENAKKEALVLSFIAPCFGTPRVQENPTQLDQFEGFSTRQVCCDILDQHAITQLNEYDILLDAFPPDRTDFETSVHVCRDKDATSIKNGKKRGTHSIKNKDDNNLSSVETTKSAVAKTKTSQISGAASAKILASFLIKKKAS